MFGCLLLIFARENSLDSLKRINTVKIKVGTGGVTANKGSTAIKLNYEDSTILFLNCHLSSG